jgi:tripartite-type tricarboxylate transporter receptor subunit TctC
MQHARSPWNVFSPADPMNVLGARLFRWLAMSASLIAATSVDAQAQSRPSKPTRAIVPFAPGGAGLRRVGCSWGAYHALPPVCWHHVIRWFARALLAGAVLTCTGAHAQPYPSKPIRVIVPFAPGGIADFAARGISPRLGEALGVQIVIENRGGAAGITGSDVVAKAPADGYTALITSISHTINLSVNKNLPYDTRRDFAAVSLIADAPNILVIHPSLPATSVRELTALARSRPGAITYASSGSGTSTHLSAELFKAMTKVNLVHIPYKGGGPAVIDLIGGHVQAMFSSLPSAVGHVRTGRLRALAVTGGRRFPTTPDVPTVAEAGVPGYEVSSWTGLFVPAGTPRDAVVRLAGETQKILAAPKTKEQFLALGAEPGSKSLEQFAAFVDAEIVKWKKVVEYSGATAD